MSSSASHAPAKPEPRPIFSPVNLSSVVPFALCIAAYAVFAYSQDPDAMPSKLPPQAIFVSPLGSAVQPLGIPFRQSSMDTGFNPTNTTPPFFQIFHPSFLSVLGKNPSIYEVTSNETFAFAHEAPIWNPRKNEVFFSSHHGVGGDLNNVVGKISLDDVAAAVRKNATGQINVAVTSLTLSDDVQMTNGGTGLYKSSLLLITSGRGPRPPSIVLVDPEAPHKSRVLLNNYFGRQFNSLNDIKVHPSGKIFFTDSTYGYLNHFRPAPLLPNQVYRLDPKTGSVRAVADGFTRSNGLAFTGSGKTAYISDTGAIAGFLGVDQTNPATIYAFDVDRRTHAFTNRRVFAYVDAAIPDGIQVDAKGNVYSACGDGVHVWNPQGTLIGKFFLGTSSANMVFANKQLVILAETKIFVADLAVRGVLRHT